MRMSKMRIVNLVNQHKKMAEGFLNNLIESDAIPSNFSGVITPKFGSFVFIWQFQKNKLVGSTAIHVNNIANFRAKLAASVAGVDYLAPNITIKEENVES
mgnify:CR=1 FL=1